MKIFEENKLESIFVVLVTSALLRNQTTNMRLSLFSSIIFILRGYNS